MIRMFRNGLLKSRYAVAAVLLGWCLASVAPAMAANSASQSGCTKLSQTRYWKAANLIYPVSPPPTEEGLPALDGFTVSTVPAVNAKGAWVDVDFMRRPDDTNEQKPDNDDFFVPDGNQVYFLEGGMGDDYPRRDTELDDEAVVMVDPNGCITPMLHSGGDFPPVQTKGGTQ